MTPRPYMKLIFKKWKNDILAKEKIAKIESAWQDAELRAEKAEARLRELEAES
jgi:hypothetical protein